MEYLPVSEDTLAQAASLLRTGALVAFPTETVYGLGCDAFKPTALAKVFAAKGRPRFDPLIIHIASMESLERAADLSLLDTQAQKKLSLLAETFWPGPLTIVLPKQRQIPDLATSGLPTAAIRFPANKTAQRLITLSGTLVAAPSANPFGYLSPTRADHVRDQLGNKVDIILDGGPAETGIESTVLDISGGQQRLLRPGAVPQEAIEAVIGKVDVGSPVVGEDASRAGLVSPGQLKSHYAPRTSLAVYPLESLPSADGNSSVAYLFFDGASRDRWFAKQGATSVVIRTLSESGNMVEAAANLFQILHELDKGDDTSRSVTAIRCQSAPQQGLGVAINDRLQRAASKA